MVNVPLQMVTVYYYYCYIIIIMIQRLAGRTWVAVQNVLEVNVTFSSSRTVASLEFSNSNCCTRASPKIYPNHLPVFPQGNKNRNFCRQLPFWAQAHRLLPGHTGKMWWCFSILYNWKEEPFVTYQDFKWEAELKCFIAAKFLELDF